MFKYIKENHRLGLTIWVVSIIAIIVAEIALELKPDRGVLSTILLAPLHTTIFVVPWLLWIRSRMKKSNHKDTSGEGGMKAGEGDGDQTDDKTNRDSDASGEGSMKVDEGNEHANKASDLMGRIFLIGGTVVGIIGGFLVWVDDNGMPEGVFEWIVSIVVSIMVGGAVGFSVVVATAFVIGVLIFFWKDAWGLFHGSVLVSWSMPIILLLPIVVIGVQGPGAIPNGFLTILMLYWTAFIIVFTPLRYVVYKWNEAIEYNAIDGKPGRKVWRHIQDDPGYVTFNKEGRVNGGGNHNDYKKGDISKIKDTWFYNSRDHANDRLRTYIKVARIALPCVMLVMYLAIGKLD